MLARDPLPLRTSTAVLTAGLFLAGAPAAAQDASGPPGVPAIVARTAIPFEGRWSDPILITPLLPFQCGETEIAHVTLLPVDPLDGPPRRGKLLVMTECEGNQIHVVDPEGTLLASYASFPPGTQSMFCSAHTWVLRGPRKEPRLLVIGGLDETVYGRSCTGTLDPCASKETVLFDPLRSTWTHGPDLPERLWYPSLTVYPDSSGAFVPIVLGGTEIGGPRGCTLYDQGGMLSLLEDCSDPDDGTVDHQFQSWWTLPPPYDTWETHEPAETGSTYWWHQYPRSLLLSNGEILCAGHAVGCEDDIFSFVCVTAGQGPYGGNPVQVVDPRTSPPSRRAGPDPNLVDPATGALNYCNAVLLHTLRQGWSFDAPDASSQYELDRVLVVGGSTEAWTATATPAQAQPAALELDASRTGWTRKADPGRARVYGNLVLLPDGSSLLLGGQTSELYGSPGTSWSTPERFEPGDRGATGRWSDLAARRSVPGFGVPTPRGYHSVAILLADGRVCLMGGRQIANRPLSTQTLELYEPPYLFHAGRPVLVEAPAELGYGETAQLVVDDAAGVDRACLIGIGSVTHHFDYGQRYVELMVRPTPGDATNTLVDVRLPGSTRRGATMLPEGPYLLFVVDERATGQHLPSEAAFVKVSDRILPAQRRVTAPEKH